MKMLLQRGESPGSIWCFLEGSDLINKDRPFHEKHLHVPSYLGHKRTDQIYMSLELEIKPRSGLRSFRCVQNSVASDIFIF